MAEVPWGKICSSFNVCFFFLTVGFWEVSNLETTHFFEFSLPVYPGF